jgi:uncharacterized protein (DUF305 family)
MHGHAYRNLVIMLGLSFLSMYALMYAMVDSLANVYASVNQAYMAGLMAAPMAIIELLVMRRMYTRTRANIAILVSAGLAAIAFFLLIRMQTGVSDRQFLRSMIPHHAGAILMCEQASLQDPEIKDLCRGIVASQEEEIAQMRAKLEDLAR